MKFKPLVLATMMTPVLIGGVTGVPAADSRTVSFVNIDKGSRSGVEVRADQVIRNKSDWQRLWTQVYSVFEPAPSVQKVNFSKEMVLAVFQGEQTSGGFSIEVTNITETKRSIIVTVKEIAPSPDDAVSSGHTQPYHLVKMKKSNKEVVFQHN
jgi:hypothetical protein